MEKVYIKAEYRIPGEVYNQGYICIDGEKVTGLFSLDLMFIEIKDNILNISLHEFEPLSCIYFPVENFKCKIDSKTLESPNTYILKSLGQILKLSLLERVSNLSPYIINSFRNLHS